MGIFVTEQSRGLKQPLFSAMLEKRMCWKSTTRIANFMVLGSPTYDEFGHYVMHLLAAHVCIYEASDDPDIVNLPIIVDFHCTIETKEMSK